MAPDIEELHEHAKAGAEKDEFAPVTVSMAILAVFAAVVTLMGARVHADAMLAQTRESDQWSQYQAKVIRERSYEVFLDEINLFALQNGANIAAAKTKYSGEITRYNGEMKYIHNQANATETQVTMLERRSNWFDFGEVLLEASLVICSITMLTEKRIYWYLGLASGGGGILIAIVGFFIR